MEKHHRQKASFSQGSVSSLYGNQTRGTFIFREVLESSVLTLNASCEVVDLSVNEKALKVLTEDKRVAENTHIATIGWDTWKSPLCPSVCKIQLLSEGRSIITTLLQGLFKNEYQQLRHLIKAIFRDYSARITHIQANPFSVGFLHTSMKDFRRFESNVENLKDIFKKVFSKCSDYQIQFQVRLQLCEYSQEETDQLIHTSEDTFSDRSGTHLDKDKRHQGEGRTISGDTGDTDDTEHNAIDEMEQKFQEIEGKLKAQRHTIEAKFHEHRIQSQKMNESLETLLTHIQKLPRNRDTQSLKKLDCSGSGNNEGFTDSSGKEERKDVSKDNKRGQHDIKDVETISSKEQEACRDQTLGVVTESQLSSTGPPISVARTSEQLVTQKRQVNSLQLRQKETRQSIKRSSDETSHYETGDNSNMTYPRHINKAAVKEASEEFEKRSSNTSDIPKTSSGEMVKPTSEDSSFGTMSIQSGFDYTSSFLHHKVTSAGGAGQQFLSSYGVQASSQEVKRIIESVEQAMIDDIPMPPKAKMSLDTILCLDTSSSMGEEGLKEMKEIALSFVEGIEDIACRYEKEENIAVVTFGGRSRIAHHLSNDLSSVRNTIENLQLGGRSPLHEAFLVCLCALNGRGAVLNIGGVHLISPRLIIITDGKATDASEGSVDVETSDFNVKAQIVKIITEFKSKGPTFPKPLVWIPAGRANTEFLESLATMGGGKYLEGSQVKKLCNYQRIQQCVGEIFIYLQTQNSPSLGSFESEIDPILQIIATNMDNEEKEDIVNLLREKLDGKKGSGNPGFEVDSFDNVHEAEGLPPLGTRVTRGKDWAWDNQDTEGPGTVINHGDHSGIERGLLWVLWDNGTHNQYRYGHGNLYDVKEAPDQPRSAIDIEVGCEVTRGPDWKAEYGEQDGGVGGVGVVIRKNNDGKFKVRWRRNCYIGSYRCDKSGSKELSVRDPVDCLIDLESKSKPMDGFCSPPQHPAVTEYKDGNWVWKWKDEGTTWRQYSAEANIKLEQAYAVRPHRSCLIQRNGKSYRVLFKEMQEKSLDDESRRKVKKCKLTVNTRAVCKALIQSQNDDNDVL